MPTACCSEYRVTKLQQQFYLHKHRRENVAVRSFTCADELKRTDHLVQHLTALRAGGQGAVYTGLWNGQMVAYKLMPIVKTSSTLEYRAVRILVFILERFAPVRAARMPAFAAALCLRSSPYLQSTRLVHQACKSPHIHVPFASFTTDTMRVFVMDLALLDLKDVAAGSTRASRFVATASWRNVCQHRVMKILAGWASVVL